MRCIDVVVSPKVEFDSAASAYGPVGFLPETLVDRGPAGRRRSRRRGLSSTASARWSSTASRSRPAARRRSSTRTRPELGAFEQDKYVEGVPADGPGEVGIIKSLADKENLEVGDTIGLTTEAGVENVKVTGIFTFADSPSMGGATVVHTTLANAQDWYNAPDSISEIYVRAVDGVSAAQLADDIRAVVPDRRYGALPASRPPPR